MSSGEWYCGRHCLFLPASHIHADTATNRSANIGAFGDERRQSQAAATDEVLRDRTQYRYGFESGKAFLISSTRGFASSATITSTTSNRKRMSGLSSIRSHASAPREIRFRLARSTASTGRPKSSPARVFTSTNTSVSSSRQTTSISPPLRPRKLRKRIL